MTANSTSDSSSIFKNGKLKPGIYKIQNLFSETYLDIHQHSNKLCCRPARDLEDGKGLWEIKGFGTGYTVRRVELGKPEQFCTAIEGLDSGKPLCVNTYPTAWRIETVEDRIHRGYEYVRFYWGPTEQTWDLWGGCKDNGTEVKFCDLSPSAWQAWKLIPVKADGVFAPSQPLSETLVLSSPPLYDGDAAGLSSTRAQHAESENDDFGTIITEVTVVTTRKRYRVGDA